MKFVAIAILLGQLKGLEAEWSNPLSGVFQKNGFKVFCFEEWYNVLSATVKLYLGCGLDNCATKI